MCIHVRYINIIFVNINVSCTIHICKIENTLWTVCLHLQKWSSKFAGEKHYYDFHNASFSNLKSHIQLHAGEKTSSWNTWVWIFKPVYKPESCESVIFFFFFTDFSFRNKHIYIQIILIFFIVDQHFHRIIKL